MTPEPQHPHRPHVRFDRHPGARPHANARPRAGNLLAGQDVVIPTHLLQSAATVVSKRDDTGDRPNWDPQRQFSVHHNPIVRQLTSAGNRRVARPAPLQRSSTAPSVRTSPAGSRTVSRAGSETRTTKGDEPNEKKSRNLTRPEPVNTRRSWRLSFTPGDNDQLSLSPLGTPRSGSPVSFVDLEKHGSRDFAKRPASNPFVDRNAHASRHSSFGEILDPFLTRNNSTTSIDQTNYGIATSEPKAVYAPRDGRKRRGTIETIVDTIVPDALQKKLTSNTQKDSTLTRRSSMRKTFEQAKLRGKELQRNKGAQLAFEYGIYLFLLCFIYFVLIGIPLWNGAVWWLYWVVANKFVFAGGFSITLGIAVFYAFAPLLILFEDDPPPVEITAETKIQQNVKDTALLIPCYKSANLIAATLEAALKIFPPEHIFVLANGNSPEPLDNTEEVCRPYGVNHLWSPVGSKIVAQFVGCYAAKAFKNVLLIDDDCALPPDFPVVTDRLKGNVKCLGYTIKSVGPNSSKGNYCQQAQDLEYKLSGLQRDFAGRIGSATFPHGAIALWDRELLVKTFHEHPGFSVSEDWFFGHVARKLGSRITMCSSVFVETETPTAVFLSGGGSRGGFGEMTIFSQRFKRWNFFFVNGMWFNLAYIFGSWKLGWWEIGAKIFVFQEVYETLLYLMTPFVLPISFYVRPSFCGILLGATIIMYLLNTIIFNEVHLRRKNERIGWFTVYVYYLPYKMVLTVINVASCYWSLYKYARYFARRHPKVTEDEKAVEVVVRLEEDAYAKESGLGRSLTVRTVGGRRPVSTDSDESEMTSVAPGAGLNANADGDLYEAHYDYFDATDSGASTPRPLMSGTSAVDFAAPPKPGRSDHRTPHYTASVQSDYSGVYSDNKASETRWL
ncbi:hypothetical protein N0V90_000108 [Kalmusia sp. IMI 367209]|nr:hypothetical protein N0V90_000108 [Kalmusia sp. IMI 367209]